MDNSRELTVEFVLKPADVYTPFRWDRGNLIRWVVAALVCYIFYDLYSSSAETIRSFQGGESILAIIVILVIFILLALLLFPFLRVLALFRGTPAFTCARRVIFRSDGILFQSDNARTECKWNLFSSVFETPRVFVFSQGKAGGTYIPKRCFSSRGEITLLRQLIRKNFKGKAKLRPD